MTPRIRCLAIDDEPLALEKLTSYINKVPFLSLTAACDSAFDAMKVMSSETVDAIFTDINMPDINGMDFIRSLPQSPLVVFTTAYAEHAVNSYRVGAVDYLLKPFDFVDFQRAANKVLEKFELRTMAEAPAEVLYVKDGYRYVSLRIPDILYIGSMSEYIQFHMPERKTVTVLGSLKQILEQLPGYFLQVHRSYILNMNRVVEIDRTRITMPDGEQLYVGDSYRKALADYLHDNSLGTKR